MGETMPRAKASALPKYAERISAYVTETFDGKVREGARVIGVDHVMLWRAMRGHTIHGPSASLCEALEKHSGKPMRYWRGGEA
jgi:hypothetical protein